MDGVPATYLGRIVDKEHFRVFIYAADGSSKLVESWEAFETHMQTGLWFAEKPQPKVEAVEEVANEKPKRARNKPAPVVPLEEAADEPFIEEELIPVEREDLVFEVKDDGFLPKASK